MRQNSPPDLILLAGPNGSGKSTFALRYLSDAFRYDVKIDADEIAKTLAGSTVGVSAVKAGREALRIRKEAFDRRKSIAVETTLASNELLKFAMSAKAAGYRIVLIFLFMESFELCDFRVKHRVSRGGHSIPLDVIVRRYYRGLRALDLFLSISDEARIFNTSFESPQVLAVKHGNVVDVLDQFGWSELGIAINEASQN